MGFSHSRHGTIQAHVQYSREIDSLVELDIVTDLTRASEHHSRNYSHHHLPSLQAAG